MYDDIQTNAFPSADAPNIKTNEAVYVIVEVVPNNKAYHRKPRLSYVNFSWGSIHNNKSCFSTILFRHADQILTTLETISNHITVIMVFKYGS